MSDNTLMLHCGATPVERTDIDKIPTPKPQGRHYPLSHGQFLDCVTQQIHDVGMDITESRLGLTKDGDRLFGTFEIQKKSPQAVMFSDADVGGTFTNLVGIRNSYDKTFAASLVAGARIFVCDNLCFSGEIRMNRKNTRYIERDMPKLVGSMVNRLCNQWLNQAARLDAYADTELSSEQAHDLTMLSFRDGCIPGSQLQRVVDCWDTPTHDEFQPRNAWSLFNCFTEAQKKTPSMIPERSIALNNTFSGYCKEAIDRILDDRQLDTDISDIEDAEIIV